MAHPLVWPGKYFFYPIGNTSAVCLTRDLAPEEPADILLLGCGDPRNVLYTIYCEPPTQTRKLDFTCCDFDAGVLARNVLLLTMIVDEKPVATMWNIFFHMNLDKDSHSALVEQCKKLIVLSESLKQWNISPYGSVLKMCTAYTLSELRRHWSLYVNMQDLPQARLESVRKAFGDMSKSVLQMRYVGTFVRSAGPAFPLATSVSADLLKHYWKNGVTFTDDRHITASKFINPTFVYSLAGEGCSVHYGTDPMIPFHHAAVFGNAKGTPSIADIVKAAKATFSDWCSSFRNVSDRCVVRFFLGEVTAVCAALGAFAETRALDIGIPVARWKMQVIQMSSGEYVSGAAPHAFNVIETSNMEDHIGLLNVIIAAAPLLSRSSPSSVLYTESLVFRGQEDATKDFNERVYANITVASLLFGICPIDYLSSFSSRSNTSELMMHHLLKDEIGQFHRMTTWKSAASGDVLAAQDAAGRPVPIFDSIQLGTFLYDMYHSVFEQEDAMHFVRLNQGNMRKAIQHSNIIHYSRETFVLLLKLIRNNLRLSEQDWQDIMGRFITLHDTDTSLPMDSVNYNDFCAHLHRHAVYTVSFYHLPSSKVGIFSSWDSIPPVVRVILTIPREKLAVLEDSGEEIGTPLLQGDVKGKWSHNVFSSVHAAFGRVTPNGTSNRPSVIFQEDVTGWRGRSSLVVSFVMSSGLLTDVEPQENLNVRFSVRSTTGSVVLVPKLGFELTIFSAKLTDKAHVIVIPEQPLPRSASSFPPNRTSLLAEIGSSNPAVVELDDQCELVNTFVCRVSVENDEVKHAFSSGETPQIEQVSPCVMRLTICGHNQDVLYPFPVAGNLNKLRLARKSLWVEVMVPVSGPFKPDGMKVNPFPVIQHENHLTPWNIHRVNLSRLPALDIKIKKSEKWLNPHVGSMMSARERSLRKKHRDDALMYVKDTLHTIFVRSAGTQGGPPRRLFSLCDEATNNCDTIFFIDAMRYDLQSHTMVCDGYVLPLTRVMMPTIMSRFRHLVAKEAGMVNICTFAGEMQAWKQLLPAFVERCRSWSHGNDCEYKSQDKIPLTEEMELGPLCSCGRGKDVEGMKKVALWREFAPYVTRVALSPLFAVSYLESIGRDPTKHKCSVCRGRGKPKLMACSVCKKVRYCSQQCQKKDWKAHKPR
ncbi:hypothetical protein M422DRAFT_189460 [Sphaerobolus stellatus SS14]|uniref:MYND-type domain-containing protein n=1 Tax=Sphaerobolus stellatus (strain SS14) TaxID=990650 RepID=A0A0C9UTW7_SPHS4|nr:hypothetical protein M422DRAFT_189460 [Sphaerobolus stellatus SS14]